VVLELGGKSANIILDDADLDTACFHGAFMGLALLSGRVAPCRRGWWCGRRSTTKSSTGWSFGGFGASGVGKEMAAKATRSSFGRRALP